MNHAKRQLFQQQAARVGGGYFAQRDGADDERERLSARYAALSGYHRQKRGERHHLPQCALEQRDDIARQNRRRQVHDKPRQAVANRPPEWAQRLFLLGYAYHPIHILSRLILQHAHHIVKPQHAHQHAVVIHHRQVEQVVVFHKPRRLFAVGLHAHRYDIVVHKQGYALLRRRKHKLRQA